MRQTGHKNPPALSYLFPLIICYHQANVKQKPLFYRAFTPISSAMSRTKSGNALGIYRHTGAGGDKNLDDKVQAWFFNAIITKLV